MWPVGTQRTIPYLLGRLGTRAHDAFAAQIAPLGLRPPHVGLMNLLTEDEDLSQAELARTTGVTPAVVVALADDLAGLGAVVRERDTADRRRQHLRLTPEGRRLLDRCTVLAEQVEEQMLRSVPRTEVDRLRELLARLEADTGPATP